MKTDCSWNRCPKMRKQTDPKRSPTFGSLPESAQSRVEFIVSNLHRLFEIRYTKFELTFREWLMLDLLATTSKELPQCIIGRHLRLSQSLVVKLVDKLVARKFVERNENLANRRENLVSITAHGREIMVKMNHCTDLHHLPAHVCSKFVKIGRNIIEYMEAAANSS
jgi:DNA-binding MarR family transcriptional regulator